MTVETGTARRFGPAAAALVAAIAICAVLLAGKSGPQPGAVPEHPPQAATVAPTGGVIDEDRLADLRRRLRENPDDPLAKRQLRAFAVDYDRRLRAAIRRGDLASAERYLLELQSLSPENLKVREALRRVQEARLAAQRRPAAGSGR